MSSSVCDTMLMYKRHKGELVGPLAEKVSNQEPGYHNQMYISKFREYHNVSPDFPRKPALRTRGLRVNLVSDTKLTTGNFVGGTICLWWNCPHSIPFASIDLHSAPVTFMVFDLVCDSKSTRRYFSIATDYSCQSLQLKRSENTHVLRGHIQLLHVLATCLAM